MKSEKKYNYIYKTTNLINGKYYIGVRCTNKLKDGYIGCGVTSQKVADNRTNRGVKGFCQAVSKYGYVNFKKEILYLFKTEKEAYFYEKRLVNQRKVDSRKCYNLSRGGKTKKNNSKFYKFKGIWEFFYKQGYSLSRIGKWYGTTHGTVRLIIDRKLIDSSDRNRGLKKHAKTKSRKVRCIETGEVFSSQKEACMQMFGKRQSNISLVLSGKLDKCKGYSFEWADNC